MMQRDDTSDKRNGSIGPIWIRERSCRAVESGRRMSPLQLQAGAGLAALCLLAWVAGVLGEG
ncbi:hypothetical protein APZ41_016620, partial [Roseomonas mucosa]